MDMKSDCLLLLKLGMRQTRCFDWLQNQIYGVLKLCALGNPAGDYWLVILQFSKNRTTWKLDNFTSPCCLYFYLEGSYGSL